MVSLGSVLRLAALALLLATSCERAADKNRSSPLRVVAACASAVDYLAWLESLPRVVGAPRLASQYANGVDEVFFARSGLSAFEAFAAEAVLATRPDLVICAWYQRGDTTRVLEGQGVRIVSLRAIRGLVDVEQNLRLVAEALGLSARQSATAVDRFRSRVRRLESRKSLTAQVLPFFAYGGEGRTAGAGTVEDLMLELAGATNSARAAGLTGNCAISHERALACAPGVVLSGEGAQRRALEESSWFKTLRRERQAQIVVLPKKLRSASSPYLVDAAAELRRLLQALER